MKNGQRESNSSRAFVVLQCFGAVELLPNVVRHLPVEIGLGVDVSLPADRRGNAGPVDFGLKFLPPKGVGLSIDDSSVYGDESPATKMVQGAPSFRNFKITEQVTLKDGQSREFIAATDKVNGEVTKVEVTLTVVK